MDSLITYYPFTGNANDSSGNNNNGVVYGATLTEDRFGNGNSAYSFDGIDDYIEVTNNAKLKPTGFPVSVCAWIKANTSNQTTGLIFENEADHFYISVPAVFVLIKHPCLYFVQIIQR